MMDKLFFLSVINNNMASEALLKKTSAVAELMPEARGNAYLLFQMGTICGAGSEEEFQRKLSGFIEYLRTTDGMENLAMKLEAILQGRVEQARDLPRTREAPPPAARPTSPPRGPVTYLGSAVGAVGEGARGFVDGRSSYIDTLRGAALAPGGTAIYSQGRSGGTGTHTRGEDTYQAESIGAVGRGARGTVFTGSGAISFGGAPAFGDGARVTGAVGGAGSTIVSENRDGVTRTRVLPGTVQPFHDHGELVERIVSPGRIYELYKDGWYRDIGPWGIRTGMAGRS